ncbi:hypothetical protein QBC35DRAFT_478153 [Podospora australis]|uniref:Uncharacterized protein n=1 Tax=Podospora australis TaxID=1536484 RepID=A0AAN6WLF5_9PEZI|nr:hypothetical protein QBC35DRAFT_478153 [Podospora australis]
MLGPCIQFYHPTKMPNKTSSPSAPSSKAKPTGISRPVPSKSIINPWRPKRDIPEPLLRQIVPGPNPPADFQAPLLLLVNLPWLQEKQSVTSCPETNPVSPRPRPKIPRPRIPVYPPVLKENPHPPPYRQKSRRQKRKEKQKNWKPTLSGITECSEPDKMAVKKHQVLLLLPRRKRAGAAAAAATRKDGYL